MSVAGARRSTSKRSPIAEEALLSDVSIGVSKRDETLIVVKGKVREDPDDRAVHFYAACPPDVRNSFAGSGLPYASPSQAFYGTPNVGRVQTVGPDRAFTITFVSPNSYYIGLGTVMVPPAVHVWYVKDGREKRKAIKISDGIPYRGLTYPVRPMRPRGGVDFYVTTFEAEVPRTQEQILRDSAYPASIHAPASSDFWNGRPPN